MQSLKFKQLQIISHSQKSGNHFIFSEGLNLITAEGNSYGKSTLAKLLFWGVGCDPVLDDTWKSLDCAVLVDFSVNDINYTTYRYKDGIKLKQANQPIEEFSKITGNYSVRIADIVNFHALLPNQSTNVLEIPPPGYYFLPFYIDQLKGWASPWESFDKLKQYSGWKPNVIKYHVGLLNAEYFENEQLINDRKLTQSSLEQEVSELENALNVVSKYINSDVITIDAQELDRMTLEIEEDLGELATSQETLLEKISTLEAERANLVYQAGIARAAIGELEKDYLFAVENIVGDTIQCPLCGTTYANSVANRSSILSDKNEASNQLEHIEIKIASYTEKIERSKNRLDKIRNDIDTIDNKYTINTNDRAISTQDVINTIAARTIKNEVTQQQNKSKASITDLRREIRSFAKNKKTIITKEHIDLINEQFNITLLYYTTHLNINRIQSEKSPSPLSYNSIFKEGGAAERTRRVLAYYLTIFSLINKFGSEAIPALVIDTPNQQEQSSDNYEKIVDVLINHMPKSSQVILCALDNDQLSKFKESAHVITLTENRLLDPNRYKKVSVSFIGYSDPEKL